MKVLELLLVQDVPKLGRKGEIVKVKNGYGRNFLLPNKMASTVTKESLRQLEVEKKRQLQLELAKKEELKKMAKVLEVSTCNIEIKANEEGKLFGSISYATISEVFQKMGFDVKAEDIELEDASRYPIKELGIFPIQIRLHPEITAKGKVWVVPETES
ncbi:MAG: 50S ribosomal protein L9 [Candidatus Brocadiae bacterium]|nr:50S ribosomal protein L9 [Candidatus Brocadiia bacterium]